MLQSDRADRRFSKGATIDELSDALALQLVEVDPSLQSIIPPPTGGGGTVNIKEMKVAGTDFTIQEVISHMLKRGAAPAEPPPEAMPPAGGMPMPAGPGGMV